MKKVICWTLYFLALAAAVLCFVFPVQAKEVCDNIMGVLNTPIAIAGVSVTLGGLLSFIISKYIMSSSKFGRKELDAMKNELRDAKNELTVYKNNITHEVEKCLLDVQLLEKDCNNQVTIMLHEFEDLQDKTLEALKTIPNKKVQNIVALYEENYEVRKQEIIDKTIHTDEYVDKRIKELEDLLNEAKEIFNNKAEEE